MKMMEEFSKTIQYAGQVCVLFESGVALASFVPALAPSPETCIIASEGAVGEEQCKTFQTIVLA